MCKKIKSLLCSIAGIVSHQHRLKTCIVDGGPGTVLKYIYIKKFPDWTYRLECMYLI